MPLSALSGGGGLLRPNLSFSRSNSSAAIEDEEQLTFAALQRIDELAAFEADAQRHLKPNKESTERDKALQELNAAYPSEQALLEAINDRFKRAGVRTPSVIVKYIDLTVERTAATGKDALPSLRRSLLQCFASKSRKTTGKAVACASGRFKPGVSTLLLGPPGSGKSSLMKAVSGRVPHSKTCQVSGRITYNDVEVNEVQMKKTTSYIDQVDNHIPVLTVRETMDISCVLQGESDWRAVMEGAMRNEEEKAERGELDKRAGDEQLDKFIISLSSEKVRLVVDFTINVLGLSQCANTIVGNAYVRGCSGGERKRVTTGEMYVGPALGMFFDEISTGLDSASTYQVANSIVQCSHLLGMVAVVSLLQPEQQVYDLFDEVLVMAEGHVIFHGPRGQLEPHFGLLGFARQPGMTAADFVQNLTSEKDQQELWADGDKKRAYLPVAKFVEAWQSSPLQTAMMKEVGAPLANDEQFPPSAIVSKRYHHTFWRYTKTLFRRELALCQRDLVVTIVRMTQATLVAATVGLLFYKRPINFNGATNIIGAIAFGLNFINMQSVATVSVTHTRMPVFYKQRDNLFFPPTSALLPQVATVLPVIAAEATIFTILFYFLVGLTPAPAPFFIFLLIVFLIDTFADQVFRTIGALFHSMPTGNAIGTAVLLVLQITNGLTILRGAVPPGWSWAYWISPFSWSLRALAINEFLQDRWQDVTTPQGATLGDTVLTAFDMYPEQHWVWWGVLMLIAYAALFLGTTGLTYIMNKRPEGIATITPHTPSAEASVTSPLSAGDMGVKQAREGTELSFEPMTLVFQELSYYVRNPGGGKGEELQLLHAITGSFRPGVLTALMGSSGAGKTTLMDVIAGRKTSGRTEGVIKLNGFPKVERTFARVMGYVEQNDLHSELTTVGEALRFSALLRLPDHLPYAVKAAHVEQVAEMVELTPLLGALVGEAGVNGLSTEQRKRLTIAVELVANPSIIFMDEPTSGLDSRAAAIVVRVLRGIVGSGRTVVATIHQPAVPIFAAFHDLLLLKRGGFTVFFGPLGPGASLMVNYFQGLGERVPRFVEGENPSTWMLDVLGGAQVKEEGYPDLAEAYTQSSIFQEAKCEAARLVEPSPGATPLAFPTLCATSMWTQVVENCRKGFSQYGRNPSYNLVRYLVTIFCAFVFGTMYLGLGSQYNTQQDIQNIMGALYALNVFLGLMNAFTVLEPRAKERAVYYRERAANMYQPLAYSLSSTLVEVPYQLVQSLLYVSIAYWMIGFAADAGKYFFFLLTNFLILMMCTSFGIFLVNATPSISEAALLMGFIGANWDLLTGFFIPLPDMPAAFRVAYYANPMAYVLYATAVNQLGDVHDLVTVIDGVTGAPKQVTVRDYIFNVYRFERGGFPGMWGSVAVLAAFVVLFFLGSVLTLKYVNFMRR